VFSEALVAAPEVDEIGLLVFRYHDKPPGLTVFEICYALDPGHNNSDSRGRKLNGDIRYRLINHDLFIRCREIGDRPVRRDMNYLQTWDNKKAQDYYQATLDRYKAHPQNVPYFRALTEWVSLGNEIADYPPNKEAKEKKSKKSKKAKKSGKKSRDVEIPDLQSEDEASEEEGIEETETESQLSGNAVIDDMPGEPGPEQTPQSIEDTDTQCQVLGNRLIENLAGMEGEDEASMYITEPTSTQDRNRAFSPDSISEPQQKIRRLDQGTESKPEETGVAKSMDNGILNGADLEGSLGTGFLGGDAKNAVFGEKNRSSNDHIIDVRSDVQSTAEKPVRGKRLDDDLVDQSFTEKQAIRHSRADKSSNEERPNIFAKDNIVSDDNYFSSGSSGKHSKVKAQAGANKSVVGKKRTSEDRNIGNNAKKTKMDQPIPYSKHVKPPGPKLDVFSREIPPKKTRFKPKVPPRPRPTISPANIYTVREEDAVVNKGAGDVVKDPEELKLQIIAVTAKIRNLLDKYKTKKNALSAPNKNRSQEDISRDSEYLKNLSEKLKKARDDEGSLKQQLSRMGREFM